MATLEDVAQLYQTDYERLVRKSMKKRGIAREEIEDIVQDWFLYICADGKNGRPRYERYDNLRAVAYHAMPQRIKNWIRDHKKVNEDGELVLVYVGELNDEDYPWLVCEDAEKWSHAERRLALLPDTLREVCLLLLEGYSQYEMAEKLECSQSTVSRRITRAIECLYGIIDKERNFF